MCETPPCLIVLPLTDILFHLPRPFQLPTDDLRVATAVGVGAGAVNGMMINVLAVVKYHMWNSPRRLTFASAAREMLAHGGGKAFLKGMYATGTHSPPTSPPTQLTAAGTLTALPTTTHAGRGTGATRSAGHGLRRDV